jgi:hypothetical protein
VSTEQILLLLLFVVVWLVRGIAQWLKSRNAPPAPPPEMEEEAETFRLPPPAPRPAPRSEAPAPWPVPRRSEAARPPAPARREGRSLESTVPESTEPVWSGDRMVRFPRDAGQPLPVMTAPTGGAPPAPPRVRRREATFALGDAGEVRRGVVMMTVLGPCRAMERHEPPA